MENFIVQVSEHTFACAEIISSVEGGYVVAYRGVLYIVYGKEPGSTITPSDMKA